MAAAPRPVIPVVLILRAPPLGPFAQSSLGDSQPQTEALWPQPVLLLHTRMPQRLTSLLKPWFRPCEPCPIPYTKRRPIMHMAA